MSAIHLSAAIGFSARADAYMQGRPGYPPDAEHWLRTDLALCKGKTALDLGAGTGKFLPYLIATGATIIAVEPVAAMRDRLVESHPSVQAMEGTAEAIPLADSTLDAVLCAQSFHWFASSAALAEIHRVLKPGGVLGLIWNNRNIDTPWVAAIEAVTQPYERETPSQKSGAWLRLFPADGFGPLSERSYEHGHRGDPERVIIERIRSVSYIAALAPEEQALVVTRLREIIATAPALAGQSNVTFPYRTAAYHCRRR